jgi:hypothetical protein
MVPLDILARVCGIHPLMYMPNEEDKKLIRMNKVVTSYVAMPDAPTFFELYKHVVKVKIAPGCNTPIVQVPARVHKEEVAMFAL